MVQIEKSLATSDSGNHMSVKEVIAYITTITPTYIMTGVFIFFYIDFFYDNLGLDPFMFSLAMGIYAIINAFNDPLLAILSDYTDPKRWGSRRLIYIRWGGLGWAFVFALTWFPWSLSDQLIIFFHFLLTICMWDMGFSLVIMCWMALLPELEDNLRARIRISWIVGFVTMIAGAVAIGFSGIFENDFSLFQLINVIVAALVVISIFFSTRFLHEREEYSFDERVPFWMGIKIALHSRSFMTFVGYNFFARVLVTSISYSYIFIYILVVPIGQIGIYLVWVIPLLIAPPIALKMENRWGMKKSTMFFGFIQILGGLLLFILSILMQETFITLIAFIWNTFISGIYGAYTRTLQTQPMDEDELKTGSRRETTFLGVNALFTKPADSLGPIITIWILETTGYIRDSLIQPESALLGIQTILLFLPLLFTAIGLIFLYFYPIHGEYERELYQKLDALHREKRKSFYTQSD